MAELDPWAAALRGPHMAALISAAGALLFRALVLPRAANGGGTAAIARVSLLAGFLFGAVWLAIVAQSIAGTPDLASTIAVLPTVVTQTRFGHLLAARLVLLLLAVATVRRDRTVVALALSLAALVLQPFLGHAGANDDWALAGTESLHLIGAACWLGGLLPLLLVVARSPAPVALAAARRFSPFALASVLLILLTALVQAASLIGSLFALAHTDYGRAAMTKIVLVAFLLVFAALNRFVFTGRHGERHPEAARRRLRASIGAEVALGVAVILAAGVLASLPPAAMVHHVHP
jgi:copper resistance protein D